jgi:hypothetical protein
VVEKGKERNGGVRERERERGGGGKSGVEREREIGREC